jgi:hypothetical protein
MYVTINEMDFVHGFTGDAEGHFTYEARKALFEYYEDDPEFEFDPLAICCDWVEYTSVLDALGEYGLASLDELEDNTCVISDYYNNHVLVMCF